MPRKKNPNPAPRGGARPGAGRKSKLKDPLLMQNWKTELKRALKLAVGNGMSLRRGVFFTVAEIEQNYGVKAVEEFKLWFESTRTFDFIEADKLVQKAKNNKWDHDKLQELINKNCHHWEWHLKLSKQVDAWKVARSITSTVPKVVLDPEDIPY